MGVRSWLGRKISGSGGKKGDSAGVEEAVAGLPGFQGAQLKRFWNRKWEKVDEFRVVPATEKEFQELMQNGDYEAGKYRLDGIFPNGQFKSIYNVALQGEEGVVPVGDETEREVGRRPKSAIRAFMEEVKELGDTKDEIEKTFTSVRMILGGGSDGGKSIDQSFEEWMTRDYDKFKKRAEFYGYSKASGVKSGIIGDVPITGSAPWYAVYGPQLMDMYMEKIERRLTDWGVVDSEGAKAKKEIEDRLKSPLPNVDTIPDIPRINPDALKGSVQDTVEVKKDTFKVEGEKK